MSGMMADVEALNRVEAGTKVYIDALKQNKKILMEAGQACAEAMGNDPIIRQYLVMLQNAIKEVDKTVKKCEQMIKTIQTEKRRIEELGKV